VTPGIWLGRRPYLKELPPGIGLVIDLTAEFPAERALRREIPYLCLPVLDAFVPSDAAFLDAVDRVMRETRPVYIHCAMGRGRSASLAAAIAIKKGLAVDVESAEQLLRKTRGGVRLNRLQRAQVRRLMGR
jgi:protein-tyrosine phosphatase